MSDLRVMPSVELVETIVHDACHATGADFWAVMSGRHDSLSVKARRLSIRAIHACGPDRYSLAGIGRRLGIDHTTVIYHLRDEVKARKNLQARRWHMANRMTTGPVFQPAINPNQSQMERHND